MHGDAWRCMEMMEMEMKPIAFTFERGNECKYTKHSHPVPGGLPIAFSNIVLECGFAFFRLFFGSIFEVFVGERFSRRLEIQSKPMHSNGISTQLL